MPAARRLARISVEDYLAGELVSSVKHEFVDGIVYAMAGARNQHNRIAVNAIGSLHSQLRGQTCEVFNSDTKVRIRQGHSLKFYYPDASVVCDSNTDEESYQDRPIVIVEVLSKSTRRIDEAEKRDAYLSIPSLAAYLLIELETPDVAVYRHSKSGFAHEEYSGLEAVIALPEIGISLPLAEIYSRVEFSPEPELTSDE